MKFLEELAQKTLRFLTWGHQEEEETEEEEEEEEEET